MKVTKEGTVPTFRTECMICHSVLEYELKDVEEARRTPMGNILSGIIVCPVCGVPFTVAGFDEPIEKAPLPQHPEPDEYTPF